MANSAEEIKRRLAEINKKHGVSTAETTKPSSEKATQVRTKLAEINKKHGFSQDVDEQYINMFISDARSFLGNAQKDYNTIGYKNASSVYDSRNRLKQDLDSRAEAIRTWLYQRDNTIDADTRESVWDMLNQYRTNSSSVMDAFSKVKKAYSAFKTEDEYNSYLDELKKREDQRVMDTEAGQLEIADLQSRYEKARELQLLFDRKYPANWERPTTHPQYQKDLKEIKDLLGEYETVEDMRNGITQKTQYLNQAKRMQNDAKLTSDAINDPEFERYAQMGAALENPSYSDARKKDIQNKATFSRENYEKAMEDYARNATGNIAPRGVENVNDLFFQMNEEEQKIYDYYAARDVENGTDFADAYFKSIEQDLQNRKAYGIADNVDGFAESLIFATAVGGDQFANGIKNLFNSEADYIANSAYQVASGLVREKLADDGFKLPEKLGGASIGQVAYDLTNTTANMFPSIIASSMPVVGQYLGPVTMGGSAAGNAYTEMLNLGYDKGQARSYATLVGASEAGLQYLLGGIGKLGGKISGQAISKILDGVDNGLARVAIKLGGNMLSEFTEESLQEILTPIYKNLIFGEDINIDWSEAIYSGILGALSANLFEGGDTIRTEANAKGNALLSEVGSNALLDVAYDAALNASGKEQGKLQRSLDNISKKESPQEYLESKPRKAAKLYENTRNVAGNKFDTIVASLKESGMNDASANAVAKRIVKDVVNRNSFSADTYQQVLKAYKSESNNAIQTVRAEFDKVNTDYANRLKATTAKPQAAEVATPVDVAAEVENVQQTDNIREILSEVGNDIKKASAIMSIYEAARGGLAKNTAISDTLNAKSLTAEQVNAAYNAGIAARSAQASAQPISNVKAAKPGVIREYTGKASHTSIRALDAVAKKTGKAVHVVDSIDQIVGFDGRTSAKVYKRIGREGNANAFYNTKTGEYYIALDALDKSYLLVAMHESVHDGAQNNREGFEKLANITKEVLIKNGYDAAELDNVEDLEEFMCNTVPVILTDRATIDEFVSRIIGADVSTRNAFQRFLDRVYNSILEAYNALKNDPQWSQMEKLRNDLEGIKKMREAYFEMLENSQEHSQKKYLQNKIKTSLKVKHTNGQSITLLSVTNITNSEILNFLKLARKGSLQRTAYIPVRKDTPKIILDALRSSGLRVTNAPMVMQVDKAQKSMRTTGDGHGLSEQQLFEIIQNLDTPNAIVYQSNRIGKGGKKLPDNVAVFVNYDFNEREGLAVVEFDPEFQDGVVGDEDGETVYHTVVTVFEPDTERYGYEFDYLNELLEDPNNYEIEIKKDSYNEGATGEIHPNTQEIGAFNESVAQSEQKSQGKFSTKTDSSYLEAVNRGDMETAQKMVDQAAKEAGYPIKAYHGTRRADRVGNVFRADRATSGPMAFFTDSKEIAEHYAKDKADTSLAYDEEYSDYYSQFRVKQNGKSIKVQDLWRSLPFTEKQLLKEAGKHITWDEDMENIVWDDDATHGLGNWDAYTLNLHKGNAIEALIDAWLESGELYGNEGDFLKVLELAGIKGVEYRDPDARFEKVYNSFLGIQNPFNTAKVDDNFANGFEAWYSQQPKSKYERDTAVADMWDKNSQTAESFLGRLRDDIENGTAYAWTSIPDSMTDYLKYLGHDGIQDTGGKNGGTEHTVYIPFSSEQVKSADPVTYDDAGNVIPLSERFNAKNNDIRYSAKTPKNFRTDAEILKTAKGTTEAEKNALSLYNLNRESLAQRTSNLLMLQEQLETAKGKDKSALAAQIRRMENDVQEFEARMNKLREKQELQDILIRERISAWGDFLSEFGAIDKGEQAEGTEPNREIDVPAALNKTSKVSKYARTILEAKTIPDEMIDPIRAKILEGGMSYIPESNASVMAVAMARTEEKNISNAWEIWDAAVRGEIKKVDSSITALGEALLKRTAESGDAKQTVILAAELTEMFSRAGKVLQSAKLLKRMGVAGQIAYLDRTVASINRSIAKRGSKIASKYHVTIDENLMNDLLSAKTEEDRDVAMAKIYQNIADQMPNTWVDKWNAWRYLAMLGNPLTHIRNIVGNAMFVPAITAKNVIATGIEKSMIRMGAKFAPTKALIVDKQYSQFAKNDFEEIKNELVGGSKYNDEDQIRAKQKVFGFKPLEAVRNFNFNLLEMEDGLFLKMHYRNALGQYLKANKIDLTMMSQETLGKARAYAIMEAQKATYRDASSLANALQTAGNNSSILKFALDSVVPFKKTPINVLKRGVEYSPIGLVTTMAKGLNSVIKKGKTGSGTMTMAEFIDGMAAGTVGTGVVAIGYFLASLGMLVGGLGDDDEDRLRKLTGEQGYAIKIGDHTYTISWAAPISLPLLVGAALYDTINEKREWDASSVFEALSLVTEPMVTLSMLDGIQSMLESAAMAKKEERLSKLSEAAISSYVSQPFPTALAQIARIIDPNQRSMYVDKTNKVPDGIERIGQSIMKKIPGLTKLIMASRNEWGEERTSGIGERLVENLVSPGYYSKVEYNAVETELARLLDATGDGAIVPDTPSKKINNMDLTRDEYEAYVALIGQPSLKLLSELIETDEYKAMADDEKAAAIKYAHTYVKELAKYGIKPEIGEPADWIMQLSNSSGDVAATAQGILDHTQEQYIGTKQKDAFWVAIDSNDMNSAKAYIDEQRATGKDDYSIWQSVQSKYKEVYIDLVSADNTAEADALAKKLKGLGLKNKEGEAYASDKTFKKWQFELESGFSWDNRYDSYKNGEITAAELKKQLMGVEGYTADEARNKIAQLDYQKAHPDTYVDDSWISKYYDEVRSSGISLDSYILYRSKVKGVTGKGMKEKRMDAINSLPISNAQKDAIYFSEGYAKSTLHEAPWH